MFSPDEMLKFWAGNQAVALRSMAKIRRGAYTPGSPMNAVLDRLASLDDEHASNLEAICEEKPAEVDQ